jgi:hypothetical protein
MIWAFRCQLCDHPNKRTRDWWYCTNCGWCVPTELGRKQRDPKPVFAVEGFAAAEGQQ